MSDLASAQSGPVPTIVGRVAGPPPAVSRPPTLARSSVKGHCGGDEGGGNDPLRSPGRRARPGRRPARTGGGRTTRTGPCDQRGHAVLGTTEGVTAAGRRGPWRPLGRREGRPAGRLAGGGLFTSPSRELVAVRRAASPAMSTCARCGRRAGGLPVPRAGRCPLGCPCTSPSRRAGHCDRGNQRRPGACRYGRSSVHAESWRERSRP
jgi:hypothetical protein